MFNQSKNNVIIEGILSEININEGSYNKDGRKVEMLSGSIKVQVEQEISKELKVCEIPVNVFANKFKKDGTKNPAYDGLLRVKDEYVSIAAGGIERADRVRIGGARISVNEYYNNNDRLVSFPRIAASFVNRVRKEECKPIAKFEVDAIVRNIAEEINTNGEETGRYRVVALLPQYGNVMDEVTFFAKSPGVIEAINTYWQPNDTVSMSGMLDFSSVTQTITENLGFGDPVEKTRTVNVSDLIITGGSQGPVEDVLSYNREQIQEGLVNRETRLRNMKDRASKKAAAPAASASSAADYGF